MIVSSILFCQCRCHRIAVRCADIRHVAFLIDGSMEYANAKTRKDAGSFKFGGHDQVLSRSLGNSGMNGYQQHVTNIVPKRHTEQSPRS